MFLGDYHTHTTYSRRGKKLHAKGTVLQNAEAAMRMGLRELAVTDHGFGHYYGVDGDAAFDLLKAECAEAQTKTGVRVYAGLENDLDYRAGKKSKFPPLPELSGAIADKLEIVQGGYHAMFGTPTIVNNMFFWAHNVVLGFAGRKKLIEHNTAAYIRMIDEYPIDFIGHLNRGILADAVEVAKYAHAHGVYIELNGRHKNLTKSELRAMVDADVEFICNSDAHTPGDVGKMTFGAELIEECGIPYELIANWDRLPNFRSKNFINARRGRDGIKGEDDNVDD